jgi:energy-coupling factor transporter transmembrane protein EcfT
VARPDPRTALFFGATAAAASLSGPVAAAGVLVVSAALAAATRLEARRFLPLAGSFALVLVLVPVAPRAAGTAVLQGLAVSVAVVVSVSTARWDRLVAVLQSLGAGRGVVAFLAIALSQVESAGRDARRALDALHLRGAFRGARGIGRGATLLLARELRRAVAQADRTADALALRGFDGRVPPPPRYMPGGGDLAAAAAALACLALLAGSLQPWSR